jgi:rod shape-determining protein MreC
MSRASERQRQKYTPWLLGALLLSQLILMAVTSRHRSPDDGSEQSILRSWTLTLVTPIQSGIGSVLSGIGSVWHGYVDLRGVRGRNETLEAENARLRAEIESARAAAAENERLRKELELKPLLKYDSVAAEVVARDATVWFKRVTINKGTLAGVRRDMPVVTPDGLVGRVVAVGLNAAQVQLITDEHAGVGGRLTRSRAAGELKGRDDGRCRFKSISGLDTDLDNDAILTSGLDRIYPAGILVGYVESVKPGAGAVPLDITVRPAADLDRLEEVLVLIVAPQDLATPETVK